MYENMGFFNNYDSKMRISVSDVKFQVLKRSNFKISSTYVRLKKELNETRIIIIRYKIRFDQSGFAQ